MGCNNARLVGYAIPIQQKPVIINQVLHPSPPPCPPINLPLSLAIKPPLAFPINSPLQYDPPLAYAPPLHNDPPLAYAPPLQYDPPLAYAPPLQYDPPPLPAVPPFTYDQAPLAVSSLAYAPQTQLGQPLTYAPPPPAAPFASSVQNALPASFNVSQILSNSSPTSLPQGGLISKTNPSLFFMIQSH